MGGGGVKLDPTTSSCSMVIVATNGANVFCFLSSLSLLPPATTAVFGSIPVISVISVISLLLKGPKHEIFGSGFFTLIKPIWIGDLGTSTKN